MSILKVKDGSTWVDVPAIVGPEGEDGYSPTVSVEEIEGGHEVTITDADGAHSFDVMDGQGGSDPTLSAHVAQLWGNQLTGELSGTIDTAADAYAAPPMALTVEGKSEQVTTTGKNLVSDVAEDWVLSSISGANRKALFIPVEEGSYTYHRRESYGAIGFIGTWYNDTTEESLGLGTWTNYPTRTVTNDGSWTHLVLSIAASIFSIGMIQTAEVQVEKGGAFTTYEPYTGGLPSPRPDWPQPIMSVDGVELHASADGTTDATNWPVTLYDGMLRSLPDGTKDELHLAYLRPSTREGWAVYQATLTALVGMTTTAATDGITGTMGVDVMSTTGEIADGPTVLYKLASAQTTTLDPIELPTLPAPNATVWCDGGSAQPTYSMEYVRDTTIVIQQLEAAIADLATTTHIGGTND